ncbi:hypothetical protein R6Q57_029995 [Mikania cordata]
MESLLPQETTVHNCYQNLHQKKVELRPTKAITKPIHHSTIVLPPSLPTSWIPANDVSGVFSPPTPSAIYVVDILRGSGRDLKPYLKWW